MNNEYPGNGPVSYDGASRVTVRGRRDPSRSKSRFVITHPAQAAGEEHRGHVAGTAGMSFLPELQPLAASGRLIYENTGAASRPAAPGRDRIHIIGLGDVGAHCALGLRLLGDASMTVGLYARDYRSAEAMRMELLQCRPHDPGILLPDVRALEHPDLLHCDALVFAASAGVPEKLAPGEDVRMMQLAKNREILKLYLERIRNEGFSGTLFILSDPVDALCAYAARELEDVLPRERILGLGLGVMAARAAFYAEEAAPEYRTEGRAYGPHGEGLWIANSLTAYDDARSFRLTELARSANLAIRSLGRKPFYGPSLSSGAWSLIAWQRGEPFYASVALSDIYFGCRVRRIGIDLCPEYTDVPAELAARLDDTIEQLRRIV